MTGPRLHRAVIGDDGRPECSCGSGVTEWAAEHDWDVELICWRSQTPIATRGYMDSLTAPPDTAATTAAIAAEALAEYSAYSLSSALSMAAEALGYDAGGVEYRAALDHAGSHPALSTPEVLERLAATTAPADR